MSTKVPYPQSPGVIIQTEFINQQGPATLADKTGLPLDVCHAIIHRELPITQHLADRLSVAFGNSVEFWLNLQSKFDERMSEWRSANVYNQTAPNYVTFEFLRPEMQSYNGVPPADVAWTASIPFSRINFRFNVRDEYGGSNVLQCAAWLRHGAGRAEIADALRMLADGIEGEKLTSSHGETVHVNIDHYPGIKDLDLANGQWLWDIPSKYKPNPEAMKLPL